MSKKAEALVWERSRAKGSNLLMLVRIADLAGHDGRYAWPSAQFLADETRMSIRAAQYVLHRLERDGELRIEMNTEGRPVDNDGRRFLPAWFLHVRCVYDWEAYQTENPKFAKFASSAFRRGRRRSGTLNAKIANSEAAEKRKDCVVNRKIASDKSQNHVEHIRKDPLVDPLAEQEQGAAAPVTPERTPDDNYAVIESLVYDTIDLCRLEDLVEAVKSRCASLGITPYGGGVVQRAIDSVLWKRQRRQAGL